MTSPDDSSEARAPTGLLSSRLVARVQNVATRLRVILAVPALIMLFAFTDRGPLWPGAAIALAGEAFQLWATAHLRKNILLVKSGPYAWVRNPMYFGRFFVGLGFTLVTWRWFIIVPYVIIYAVYAQARVLQEERRLRDLFGTEYADYCGAVNRWLPRPPHQQLSEERWSWAAVFHNHELRVAGGVLIVLVGLYLRLTFSDQLWGGW